MRVVLTKKAARRLLAQFGQRMQADNCDVLTAALRIYKEHVAGMKLAQAAGDQARAEIHDKAARLIRRFMYACGTGRVFDRLRYAEDPQPDDTQKQHAARRIVRLIPHFHSDAKNPQEGQQLAEQVAAAAALPSPAQAQAQAEANAKAAIAAQAQAQQQQEQQAAASGSTSSSTPSRPQNELLAQCAMRRLDLSQLAQAAARLRDSLAARTMSRTVRETEAGRVDRSRLAQIGAGLTLRPYEETTPGHTLETAVYLMLDASGSMAGTDGNCASRLTHVANAAAAIVGACAAARIPLAIGAFSNNPHTLWRGERGRLGAIDVLERLEDYDSTNTARAVKHATAELLRMRAKRRVLVVLCDGWLEAQKPEWQAASSLGIDWRVTGISPDGDKPPPECRTPLWKGRLKICKSGADAALDMLRELRELLDTGKREQALAQ